MLKLQHVEAGGTVYARAGSTVHTPVDMANDGNYTLYKAGEFYFAGCARLLTLDAALSRWNRDDDRGLLFTFAILFFNQPL